MLVIKEGCQFLDLPRASLRLTKTEVYRISDVMSAMKVISLRWEPGLASCSADLEEFIKRRVMYRRRKAYLDQGWLKNLDQPIVVDIGHEECPAKKQ